MPTATLSRKRSTKPRDIEVEEMTRLMVAKDVKPKEIIEVTGFSKNTIYETLNGRRRMHESNLKVVLKYLREKKVKAKPPRIGSPSADN